MVTTTTYINAYEVTVSSNGTLTIVDADGNSNNGVQPESQFVTVKEPGGAPVITGGDVTVTNGGFAEPGGGALAKGDYTFIDAMTVADNGTTLSGILVEDGNHKLYFLTEDTYSGTIGGQNGELTFASNTCCFMRGTLVRTPDGEVPVETLKRGDLVLTHDGRSVPVDWLGVQTISLRFADKMRVMPIRIRAGALGESVPSRDLLVSPDHALLIEGALIQAGALINGTSIVRETEVPTTFTYYHVEVEDHSLILAENAPAETFVDNVDRLNFDNWAEHEALHPNGKPVEELPHPRAKSHRQVPVSIRVMLGARAQMLGTLQEKVVA
jgi:hypothetical protein